MKMKTIFYISLAAICILASCKGPENSDFVESRDSGVRESMEIQASETEMAQQEKMLVSKGVIRSENEIKIYSRIEGQLNEVNLLEGSKIRKGETLFTLDQWDLQNKVLLNESSLEQATFRMEEILVSQGYKREQFGAVPERIAANARIKSGLNVCERELEISKERLSRTTIKAPVSGVVTGLTAVSYAFVKPGETLCTIVDPDHLIVEFSILETELRHFKVGSKVNVIAIAYKESEHTATVRTVGSVVGEDGMIKVEAVLQDSKDLIPGMTAIVNL